MLFLTTVAASIAELNVAPSIFLFLRLVPFFFGFLLLTYQANLVRLESAIPNHRRYKSVPCYDYLTEVVYHH